MRALILCLSLAVAVDAIAQRQTIFRNQRRVRGEGIVTEPSGGGTPPSITSHPSGLALNVGDTANFAVTATGDAPLTYQWRFGGSNIGGATSDTYSIVNVQTNHAGNYDVVVSNAAGSATSDAATLTVQEPPPAGNSLTNGLIGYWAMDEPSDESVAVTRTDSVGDNDLTDFTSGSEGKIASSASAAIAGLSANWTDTATSREWLYHSDDAIFSRGDTDFSFSVWVRPASPLKAAVVFGKIDYTPAGQQEYLLRYNTTVGRFEWGCAPGGSTITYVQSTNVTASVDTWFHIVVWHDATNNQIGMRINDANTWLVSYSGGVFNGNLEFKVGSPTNGALANAWFGRIDELGLWDRVLTGEEITALYNGGSGDNPLN